MNYELFKVLLKVDFMLQDIENSLRSLLDDYPNLHKKYIEEDL